MKDAVFDMETMVARLDPDTGALNPPAPSAAAEIDEDDSMGVTRAISISGRGDRATRAEWNPEAPGTIKNETVIWQESTWSARSAVTRVQAWLAQGNNRRSVILLLIVLSLTGVLLLTLKPKAPRGPSVSLMQSAAAEGLPPTQPEAENPSRETAPSVSFLAAEEILTISPHSEEESSLRLKDAVDALTEGRIDDALQAYRALSAAHPDDPSLALTVQILGGEKGDSR